MCIYNLFITFCIEIIDLNVSLVIITGLNSNDTSPSSASTPASLSACSMDDIRPVKRCKSLTDMPDRQLIDKRRKRHKMTPVYYHTLLNNYELKVELAVKKEVALEKALKECEHAIESIPNYSQSPPTSMPWSTATPPCYSAPSSAIWTEPGMNDYFNLSEKPTSNYLPFSATDNYGFGKETYSTCTPTADSPVDYMQNHHQLEDLQQEQYLPSTTYSPIREPHYSVPCTAVDMGTLSSPQGHSNSSIPETYGQSTEHIPDLYNSLFPY